MKSLDDTVRIAAEVLAAMPHVAMVMQFRTTDLTWRLLGQVTKGADLLEHQLGVNDITREMVMEDLTKARNEYESRQQGVDPASDVFEELFLALQAIQELGTKASQVIAGRHAAIGRALEAVLAHRKSQPVMELLYCSMG